MTVARKRFDFALHLVAQVIRQFHTVDNDGFDFTHQARPDPELDLAVDLVLEEVLLEVPESFDLEALFESSDLDDEVVLLSLELASAPSEDFFFSPLLP
jgi:hypothetical protein